VRTGDGARRSIIQPNEVSEFQKEQFRGRRDLDLPFTTTRSAKYFFVPISLYSSSPYLNPPASDSTEPQYAPGRNHLSKAFRAKTQARSSPCVIGILLIFDLSVHDNRAIETGSYLPGYHFCSLTTNKISRRFVCSRTNPKGPLYRTLDTPE